MTSLSASWVQQRYRDPALKALAYTNETIDVLLSHHSVRTFTDDPIDTETIETIVAAAQSAPTSSNLQAWSVIAVRDPARKKRLAALAGNQAFIAEAAVFLVFVADLGRARRLAAAHDAELGGADYFDSTILGAIDAALAAQNAVVAAESLGWGTVYVGAVRNAPDEIAAELALAEQSVPVVGSALGRAGEDTAGVKPRLPISSVLHHENYDAVVADAAVPVHEQRLSEYYVTQGRTSSWISSVLSRLRSGEAIGSRVTLRQSFESLGWKSR
ncbi:NADPH-dependent oxidoreductase [Rhodococcus sp. 15-725-2-2b]|uniref:NADPH-dependent oxidoreductase n=1 Tax=unclassified Rhodococcus (in: high G+C Gram-positive bacteria) TaxID=192944 RepID=UPI000B9AEE72|nr:MULTISPECIES: NADPH-dependent oxidoreductase [unclassified Rhodococcus (in: high G+C Gram-positive bacteria)]OZC68551.1 NADPH-dependent oxidoreductase [Rhodococcus sp. 06-469-3-2]OZD45228.1 NADPH-dependent oxidoreductase [Rhodococcus sp. 06-1477-1A]OZE73101.1 NADPH-dependent oxidoreductase [Rhodococcus sp. 15-725-2-2b]